LPLNPLLLMTNPMEPLDSKTLSHALTRFLSEKTPLAALRVLFEKQGRFFQIPLPGFRALLTGGPESNRQILVTERKKLLWRSPNDPVTHLLQRGVLVTDGEEHDHYRELMNPLLTPGALPAYIGQMLKQVDRVSGTWHSGQKVDMLVECRRIALLIIMDTLFSVDFWNDMPRMWKPILKAIQYISPGAWVIFPGIPRPGFRKPLKALDDYLYGIIQTRRKAPPISDLLGHLIAGGLDDSQIRDQMLTMLIAGHDTSTALLAWTFYLLGMNPDVLGHLQSELKTSFTPESLTPSGWQPHLLDEIIKESLRLYPPIHLGSRRLEEPMDLDGHTLPAGERLLYSIYLTHRDPAAWENPDQFSPERFARGHNPAPFTYVPFGGGPRACMGSAFGLAEARVVLARLLTQFRFKLVNPNVHAHMGATLEPRPGVFMRVHPALLP
jgi:cytochrome P450